MVVWAHSIQIWKAICHPSTGSLVFCLPFIAFLNWFQSKTGNCPNPLRSRRIDPTQLIQNIRRIQNLLKLAPIDLSKMKKASFYSHFIEYLLKSINWSLLKIYHNGWGLKSWVHFFQFSDDPNVLLFTFVLKKKKNKWNSSIVNHIMNFKNLIK